MQRKLATDVIALQQKVVRFVESLGEDGRRFLKQIGEKGLMLALAGTLTVGTLAGLTSCDPEKDPIEYPNGKDPNGKDPNGKDPEKPKEEPGMQDPQKIIERVMDYGFSAAKGSSDYEGVVNRIMAEIERVNKDFPSNIRGGAGLMPNGFNQYIGGSMSVGPNRCAHGQNPPEKTVYERISGTPGLEFTHIITCKDAPDEKAWIAPSVTRATSRIDYNPLDIGK